MVGFHCSFGNPSLTRSLLTEADAGHTEFTDEVYQNESRYPGGEWKAAEDTYTDAVSGLLPRESLNPSSLEPRPVNPPTMRRGLPLSSALSRVLNSLTLTLSHTSAPINYFLWRSHWACLDVGTR